MSAGTLAPADTKAAVQVAIVKTCNNDNVEVKTV